MTKKELKELCSKPELTRQDARLLLRLLFDDNYNSLSQKTFINSFYLREMLCFVKPFTTHAQEAVKKASLEKLSLRRVNKLNPSDAII
jgi:hypothetical protein